MAMYSRRSSMESFDRGQDRSATSPQGRKFSFNPVGEWEAPTGEDGEETRISLGAFEVSKTKRILQVLVAVVYCLFAAGVVFGFAVCAIGFYVCNEWALMCYIGHKTSLNRSRRLPRALYER